MAKDRRHREDTKRENSQGISLEVIDRHLARAVELLGYEDEFTTSNMLYNPSHLKSYWFGRVTALKELRGEIEGGV